MKNKITYIFGLFLCITAVQAQQTKVSSPDGSLVVEVEAEGDVSYSVALNGKSIFLDNTLSLDLGKDVLGKDAKLKSSSVKSVTETIEPVVPMKYSEIENSYNQLTLKYRKYDIQFRVYDEGFAYRFVTNTRDSLEVKNEEAVFNPSGEYTAHLQQTGSFKTAYEHPYTHVRTSDFGESQKMAVLPVLLESDDTKILISESDLEKYPAMFLNVNTPEQLSAIFPKDPIAFGPDGDRSLKLTERADYIAKVDGKRSFPWRYFLITNDEKDILENTLTVKLATQNVLDNTSWIKPGQVSWEWWNGASPYGVDFKAGFNEDTYKYFIDFASDFGIPYIIMDEGWAKSTTDPYTPNPTIDLFELIAYGKERNVDIVLWLTWLTVEKNFDLFKKFKEWGIAGVKIDFMDRSDQWMVDYYERVAKEAAKHELFVDFHGSFKPAGLEIKYPNIISYEGVLGLEQMGRATPDNSLYLPFMRNAVGPMDFTPGGMINMQPEFYHSVRPNSAAMGTRAFQMALFVVFESGVQMLADNPTNYYKEKECTEFITAVPTTWDETKILDAKIGEYVVVAKRKGEEWFVGAITNSKEQEREFTVDLSFLDASKTYNMTAFKDGVNAGRQALDYKKEQTTATTNNTITLTLVKNGGFAARLSPKY